MERKTKSLLEGRSIVITYQCRPPRPAPKPNLKPKKKTKRKPTPSLYYYQIGYGSYEDSDDVMLSHEQKFTEKQFRDLCFEAAPQAARNYVGHRKLKYIKKLLCRPRRRKEITFQDLFPFVAEQLIMHHGFKLVQSEQRFFMFGWPNIMDPKHWEDQRDEDLDALRKVIEAGLKK